MKINTSKITLTQGKFAVVDTEDYDWLNQWKWCFDNGYAHRNIEHKGKLTKIYLHRLIMNAKKGQEIDHVNRNKLDNTKSNLRFATRQLNSLNKGLQRNNTSGVKGICLVKEKYWIVYLKRNQVNKYIGCFMDFNLAVQARQRAEQSWEESI